MSKRSDNVNIRITPLEKRLWESAASAAKVPLSEFVRRANASFAFVTLCDLDPDTYLALSKEVSNLKGETK